MRSRLGIFLTEHRGCAHAQTVVLDVDAYTAQTWKIQVVLGREAEG
jgi:hypothetical protein